MITSSAWTDNLRLLIVHSLLVLTIGGCSSEHRTVADSKKMEKSVIASNDSENAACRGEIFIFYNSQKHPVKPEQILQLLKEKSAPPSTISESRFEKSAWPIVRVETALPVLIENDDNPAVLQEMTEYAKDKALSKKESLFIRTCNARLRISGAGAKIEQIGNSNAYMVREYQFAPRAKDTMKVVQIIMNSVDGIAYSSTDRRWIRRL